METSYTVEDLRRKLLDYPQDAKIWLESHCGSLNDMVGVLNSPKDDAVILCNEEGYEQKKL